MSFTAVLAMIQSLRQNARPKRKAFEYSKEKESYLKKHYGLKYKTISGEKLLKIKARIKRQAEKDNNRNLLKLLFPLALGSIVLILFSINYTNSVKANNTRIVKEREEKFAQQKIDNEAIKNKDIKHFTDAGKEFIYSKEFNKAKIQYSTALKIDPNNYEANLGFVSAFVYDCILKKENCHTSQFLVNKKFMQFGKTKELEELQEKLNEVYSIE